MPNRILKESICTSATIDALSPEEEVFFYRLLVNCDDFGRMDARPQILLARCFPLKIGIFTLSQIEGWLHSLERAGLIRLYEVDGMPYLEVVTWEKHQRVRNKKPRYPAPPEAVSSSNPKKCRRLKKTRQSPKQTCNLEQMRKSSPPTCNGLRETPNDVPQTCDSPEQNYANSKEMCNLEKTCSNPKQVDDNLPHPCDRLLQTRNLEKRCNSSQHTYGNPLQTYNLERMGNSSLPTCGNPKEVGNSLEYTCSNLSQTWNSPEEADDGPRKTCSNPQHTYTNPLQIRNLEEVDGNPLHTCNPNETCSNSKQVDGNPSQTCEDLLQVDDGLQETRNDSLHTCSDSLQTCNNSLHTCNNLTSIDSNLLTIDSNLTSIVCLNPNPNPNTNPNTNPNPNPIRSSIDPSVFSTSFSTTPRTCGEEDLRGAIGRVVEGIPENGKAKSRLYRMALRAKIRGVVTGTEYTALLERIAKAEEHELEALEEELSQSEARALSPPS
ncbi:MAG: hypothetical protein H5U36_08840 [Candidatus Caldatribacterium sp.]|nr:hypothetical protein [Candidatus Caldatribacterium sp.]